jgi:amino acid adenylation domain-containing protein
MSHKNQSSELGPRGDYPSLAANWPALLEDLAKKGTEVWFEGERLRVRSGDGAVHDHAITTLKKFQLQVIAYLRDQASRREALHPVSMGQRAMWLLNQQAPDSAAYHLAAPLFVMSPINTNALRHALQALTDRHATLRTTYHYVDGELRQMVHGGGTPEFELQAVPGLTQDELFAKVKADYQRPFNLARGPVWRTSVYTRGPCEHVLLVTVHHIAADGWSLVMLVDELFKLYSEAAGGPDAKLPRPAVEFSDYVAWQQQTLAGPEGDRLWRYWSKKLAGPLTRVDLATDFPRPAVQNFRGGSFPFVLGSDLTSTANAVARQEGTTPFVVLLAAYQSLLNRLTGTEDVIVGFPAFARNQKKFVRVAGNFVNTLPLRGTLNEAMTFREFIAQIRVAVSDAIDAQEYPFSLLVQRLQPERDPSRPPLFETSFILQRFHKYRIIEGLLSGENPDSSVELMGLQLRPYPLPQQEGPFDLTLQVVERGGTFRCIFKYNTDLFERSTIERISSCFETLLRGVTQSPEARISEQPILASSERHRLLIDWNATEADFPSTKCVHHLFEEQTNKTPQATAVVFGDGQLTYRELNERANQLAHYLRKVGVGPGMLVGLCVERSIEMVVGLLGILKAGGAYVPLDPEYPKERLSFIIADTGLNVLVTQASLDQKLSEHKLRFVYLDRDDNTISAESKEFSIGDLSGSNLAYVIYTSGSTGQPKGVLVEHRGLCNVAEAQIRTFSLQEGDRVLQFASISFDASIFEIMAAFCVGATLQLGRSVELMPGPDLVRFLEQSAINFVTLPPSALMVMPRASLPALRLITVAGEACPIGLSRRWGVGRRFFNLYGPTEATIWAAAAELTPDLDRVTIGRPISNTKLYILDKNLSPVPVGSVGDLLVGGEGIARGYLNRPQLTAERFIPDPFSNEPGARLYKTGDLARYLPDGTIEWLGRNDFQVKIRGFRIELGEIEEITRQHTEVDDAVAVVREDAPGDKRIAVYVRTKASEDAFAETLRTQLRQKLPGYMVPSNIVLMETFPRLPNGKIDRGALPAPKGDRVGRAPYVGARTAAEQALARIWAVVLRLDRIGVHDNFFELGGHSLLAVDLIQRMRKIGMPADLHSVFLHPTVEALAYAASTPGHKSDERLSVSGSSIPVGCEEITPEMLALVCLNQSDIDHIASEVSEGAEMEDVLPLLPMQEGILFHHVLTGLGNDPYLARSVLSFRQRHTLNQFLAALQTIIDRHAALRTAIIWNGLSQPVQVVHRKALLVVREITAKGTEDLFEQLMLASDPRKLHLSLSRPPLLTAFVAASEGECRLALVCHHVIADHVSLDVMFTEAQAMMQGRGLELPPPPQYREFVAQISRANLSENDTFFYNMLNDFERPALPFDLVDLRGGIETRQVEFALSDNMSAEIRRTALQQGVSPAVLFHIAWALVLGRYSCLDDVVFGTVLLGRSNGLPDFDRAVGAFINTLPIRVSFADASLAELIRQTYQHLTGLILNDQARLAVAQRCSNVAAHLPLFNAFLNYRHTRWQLSATSGDGPKRGRGNEIRILSGEERTNYPIGMTVDDTGAEFLLTAHCADIFPSEHVLTSMSNAVELLIKTIQSNIETPSRALIELLPLPEDLKGKLIHRLAAKSIRSELNGEQLKVEVPVAIDPKTAFAADSEQTIVASESDGKATIGAVPHAANRDALAAKEGASASRVDAPPQGMTEEVLHAIWREVLRRNHFGRFDNFFDLGGHSLLATQVVSRIFRTFALELPLRAIFEAPTLESLGRRIEDGLDKDNGIVVAPLIGKIKNLNSSSGQTGDQLARYGRTEVVPGHEPITEKLDSGLSYSQQRMWLIHSLDPENTAYNLSGALSLLGRLDVHALSGALDELCRRHENLRSTFLEADGEVAQQIEPWRSQELIVTDLRSFGDGAKLEALQRAHADARTPFDLARGPIVRVSLFRMSDIEHLLQITLHHISGDQWSFGIILRELAAAYNDLRAARPVSLKPIKNRYRDYALWQRRYLNHNETKKQLSYWVEKLKDLPSLALPTDYARPRVRGLNGACHLISISPSLTTQLEGLSRSEGATLFMTMLAAFALQLYRLAGQDDFAIGVPIANRTQTDVEEMVGTFVNTLALRIDLSGRPSFRDLLARVRVTALDAYSHQDVAFEKLVQDIKQPRDNSRAPLVQVMFNILNAPFYGVSFDELKWEPVILDRGGAQFELSVSVDVEISRTVTLEYNTDLFKPETIERFAAQYLQILESITDDPAQSIVSVPMLPASELRLMLHDWNDTRTNDVVRPLFVTMFEQQAAKTPDAIAVSFEGQTISYAALNASANGVARNLRELGIGPGAGVAFCIKRSIDLVVTLLGIQKAGAYYVPLDPSFPVKRLKYMLADSGVSALVADSEAKERLSAPGGLRVFDCAALMTSSNALSPSNLDGRASPSDIAYIIYTSGSTGQPKGVTVQHRSLSNFLLSMSQRLGLKRQDILVAVTTISFDIAGLELYLPLIVGARVELASRETASDGAALAGLLVESGATILQATPATWRMLLDNGWGGAKKLRALCGGEPLSRDLADALLVRVAELWNLYGPTETTIWSTAARIEPGNGPIPIGRPIANTRVYVTDREDELSPIGIPGEILIAGEGVAKGYHGRPEMTAERFAPDSFADGAGERLYRTGDLGKWSSAGILYHLGRIDNQIKIRGFRIETDEIETVLREHHAVSAAIVVAREISAGDTRLIAYVVRAGQEITVSELRDHLRAYLPDYMIPAFIIPINNIPLTPNGKVDRNALSDPFVDQERVGDEYVAPAVGLEEVIAGIWEDLLKVRDVSAGDNFFELGGHSLLALQVVRLVEKRTGKRLDPRILYFQNLRQIAEVLDQGLARLI